MGGKKGGENTKKVVGNARKADAAAKKQAEADARTAAAEAKEWNEGAKDSSKKAAEAAKKAEAAAKKAERDRQLAEEEASQRSAPKGANKKTAEKKSKGTLDLSQLDADDEQPGSKKAVTLNASGIDNALDALDLTADSNEVKLERHPERRFKAAYAKFEERRLPEIELENPGLRKNQRVELCRKEFEKSPENPFNQTGNVRYDATKEDLAARKQNIRSGVENRLGEK